MPPMARRRPRTRRRRCASSAKRPRLSRPASTGASFNAAWWARDARTSRRSLTRGRGAGQYEKKYPDVDELVMVNVRRIAEMGAYVRLLEYNNIEGMILLSELSRRRIRSVQKLIRIGRNEVVVVMRVDKDKGAPSIHGIVRRPSFPYHIEFVQVTSISRSGGFRRRKSSSARRSTTNPKLWERSGRYVSNRL